MSRLVVRISEIDPGGTDISADTEHDRWFAEVLADAIQNGNLPRTGRVSFSLCRVDDKVDMVGGIYIKVDLNCDRCLGQFTFEQQIPFRFLIEPRSSGLGEDDDLESGEMGVIYYDSDEIDLGDLIREQILLAQPIVHLCDENCKGLCPRCGKDLNTGECDCHTEVSSPFKDLLKDFKKKLKKRR